MENTRFEREKDGLKLSVGMKNGGLEIKAESAPSNGIIYTEEISASKTELVNNHTESEKESVTEPFKRCLNTFSIVLILIIIILIVLRWQKRKQDQ